MTTEHFRIYFYEEETEIAQVAAKIAEDAYRPLAAKFNHEVERSIPLIIYSSPSYFSQTNVVPGLLGESVGGFTEFLKGRVVLPFNGNYHDFEHVIIHELIHVFQLSKIAHVVSRHSSYEYSEPPLWFTEGLAEFWSKEWDTEADMVVKDMVMGNKLPSLDNMWGVYGTFYMYKLGESVCQFIDSEYGSDKLTLIYDNWPKGKTFEEVLKITLGVSLQELSRKWSYHLRRKYYPELDTLGLPKLDAEQLTNDGFNVKGVPITWEDESTGEDSWIVYMANRMGYTGLYMKPRRAGGPVKTLVKGERSSAYESLHLLRSGIDAVSQGLIAFSAKSKERDVLNIYDLNEGKVTRRFEFEDLIASRSPRFSPDGSQIVFTGYEKSGRSDLYLLDVTSGAYQPITRDLYYDTDAVFSLDGQTIYFASDRCPEGKAGALNIYEIHPKTGGIRQLTFGDYRDRTPEPTERGLYFSSDRDGSFNLFHLESDSTLSRQSIYLTGAFDPRLSADGETLMFTGYQDMGYHIYQMSLLESPKQLAQYPTTANAIWAAERIDSSATRTSMKYDTDYSFDIAQSSVGYDPVFGSIGGLQAAVSDMLGNKSWHFLVTNTARNKDEFLTSFNVGATHINREKRLNWGVGAFHLYDEYYNDIDQYYDERQAGALGLLSYPVSKFNRVDFLTFGRYSKKERRYGLSSREAFLVTNTLSYIYDNSLWDIAGPIEGRRYNLTAGVTSSISQGQLFNTLMSADIRHYVRLGKFSAYANRVFAFSSSGVEPQRLYFGGSWSFRGFNRREFYNRNILFVSNELRFPLINNLFLNLPIGGMGFNAIRGAVFVDVGSAWDDKFDGWKGSFGAGLRVGLGGLTMLRFDFTRTTDFKTISPTTDFDFFFGWNF